MFLHWLLIKKQYAGTFTNLIMTILLFFYLCSFPSIPSPPPREKIIPLSGNVEHKRQSYEEDRSDGGPYPACSHISRLGSAFYPPAPDTGREGEGFLLLQIQEFPPPPHHPRASCRSVSPLKVPSGQIGSTWEWYHWIGLEKDINRYRFLIF